MDTASWRPPDALRPSRARLRVGLQWALVASSVTALLWLWRPHLDKAHMVLAYLVVVLVGSSRHGRAAGLALAVSCFLAFDWFLLPPYYTLAVADPLDWGVLLAFLVTAAVAAELLARERSATHEADLRTREIERLAALGAETLSAGRAEAGVQAIADLLRSTLDVGSCAIYGSAEVGLPLLGSSAGPRSAAPLAAPEGLMRFVIERASAAITNADGTSRVHAVPGDRLSAVLAAHPGARCYLLPLVVRGRTVGILRLEDAGGIALAAAERRFAEALAYYAALGVERVRLLAEVERMEALEEAARLKDAVIAGVSHDLRTPLTSIKAFAHELTEGGDERAEAIVLAADRLNRFVANLLDLSRLNSGGIPVSPEYTPVDDVLSAAAQQVAGVLGDHELCVHLPSGGLLVGWFDPVQSLRALTNLIDNAAKYAPPGTPVDVSVERDGAALVFSVDDRGPGVTPEQRERIFEPFYRTRAVPDAEGSGLGLAIARRMAEAQGGTVRVADRPGGGSRFSLVLPAADLPLESLEAS